MKHRSRMVDRGICEMSTPSTFMEPFWSSKSRRRARKRVLLPLCIRVSVSCEYLVESIIPSSLAAYEHFLPTTDADIDVAKSNGTGTVYYQLMHLESLEVRLTCMRPARRISRKNHPLAKRHLALQF